MSDVRVAIVGIGMHPFGRHEGVTGEHQAAHAARAALADARVGWPGAVRRRWQPRRRRRRHPGQ